MVTQVDIETLKQQIEEQRLDAINGTMHVWVDTSNAENVISTCQKFKGVLQNENAFTTHTFSAGKNPGSFLKEMAGCVPRVIVAALCNSQDPYNQNPKRWVQEVLPTYVSKLPFAEIEWVDVHDVNKSEREFLDKYEILANPTVLVFKMGHLIDKFVPNIYDAAAEVVEITKPIIQREGPKKDIADVLVKHTAGYDPGREAYEERERKKMIAAEERKRYEELLEKKRIKDRIAAQRREQSRK